MSDMVLVMQAVYDACQPDDDDGAVIAATRRDTLRRVQEALDRLSGRVTVPTGEPVTFTYTNYRGETSERTIAPQELWYGSTEWHPEPQWFVRAIDCQKGEMRDFALEDFGVSPDQIRREALREAASKVREMSYLLSIGAPEEGPFTRQDRVCEETRNQAAEALRTLAEERDLGDKQIHGLAEERERWKARAERAEAKVESLQTHIEGTAKDTQTAMIQLTQRAERAEAEAERLRAAFRVNALRWNPGMSHAEIDAEIDRAAPDQQARDREQRPD